MSAYGDAGYRCPGTMPLQYLPPNAPPGLHTTAYRHINTRTHAKTRYRTASDAARLCCLRRAASGQSGEGMMTHISLVIPAKAEIHAVFRHRTAEKRAPFAFAIAAPIQRNVCRRGRMDSRFRGNDDGVWGWADHFLPAQGSRRYSLWRNRQSSGDSWHRNAFRRPPLASTPAPRRAPSRRNPPRCHHPPSCGQARPAPLKPNTVPARPTRLLRSTGPAPPHRRLPSNRADHRFTGLPQTEPMSLL